MSICYIVAAGDCEKISVNKNENDLIIAADAGVRYCQRDNIIPDAIIGDFDSLGFIPDSRNVISLPVAKDDTDTSFAVKYAMDKGYKKIVIFGAAGGKRADHTFANIALLSFISKSGCEGYLSCDGYTVTAITDAKISFPDYMKGDISVFSFDTVSYCVTEKGLLYSISDSDIENSDIKGVSNSFIGQKSSVSVKDGTLIVYYSGSFSDATIDKI